MDLHALREAAIEATSRALYDKHGFVPSDDSDEWEDEYRRQFALLKERYGAEVVTPPRPANGPATLQRQLPELRGTPESSAGAARSATSACARSRARRCEPSWSRPGPRAKQWIDTRDVPIRMLLQRLAPQYERLAQEADRGGRRAESRGATEGRRGSRLPAAAKGRRDHPGGSR